MTTSKEGVFEGPVQALARSAWQSILVTGILSVVLGILILVWPGPTLVVAGVLFGIYLLVSGVFQLIAAFGLHVSTWMRVLSFITAILSFILGFFCFRNEFQAIGLLALWIGITWIFRGTAVLVAAVSDSALPGRGWQILFGILLIVGGGLLIVEPFRSITTLVVVVGCWLIVIGIFEVISAFQVKSTAKRLAANL
ncbi:HdeD family acid-resistance protein [Nocardia tengchongensis]|uniref:HdeD family acid-resistance protein n=1 Tax=Nocardia tengchongensis TaxID=2055889 RepID=A0ABX8CH38_9NOCA|nr:HdeD family acid-resistance protein [Nocardia tengchongensis]QVI19278.1 HdeD family acid-resistance protein [Nocardia tengchongensis]